MFEHGKSGGIGGGGAAPGLAARKTASSEPAWLFAVDSRRPCPDPRQGSQPSDWELWLGKRSGRQKLAVIAAVAGIYFVTGKAGLALAQASGNMSLVWPATGLAIAALLLLGPAVWPAIAAGALLVGITTSRNLPVALAISAGNTLEAVLGTWLICRMAGGWRAFERSQHIFRFCLVTGCLAAPVSATLGAFGLCLGGLAPWSHYAALWAHWWLGDTVSAITIAPLIVLMATQPAPRWSGNQFTEAALLFGGLFVVSGILFIGLIPSIAETYPLTFLYIPFLFWTAFRFGPREAAVATLIISGLAICGTLQGTGRFSALPPGQALALAEVFLGVVALTTLAVAASASEGKRVKALASQLAAIVESSYDAIIGKALDGTIVSWNQGAERLYGYSAAEAIGRHISMLAPGADCDHTERILESIRRDEPVQPFETVRRRKDGSLVDISLSLSPVRDAQGNIIGASSISRDITEHKRTEAALVEANDKLKAWLNQVEQHAHEIILLNQMSNLLQISLSEEEAAGVIRQFVEKLFPGDSGAVCLRQESLDVVETMCSWGAYPPAEQVFSRHDCWALRHGQLHAVSNAQLDIICPHWYDDPWPASALCVPMMAQGEWLGVLLLRRPAVQAAEGASGPARASVTREQLAMTVAGHIGLAIANLRLRESLRSQSIRDALTGLYNRRYLNEALEREIRRAARSRRQLAVILLDVDGFKGVNDTYGHEAGDAFLRELGAFLQKRVREEDVACSYGGDEFVIVLTETSLETARKRARQLREGIKGLSISHRGQYLAPPTISLGAALYPEHGASADELLRTADDALYKAKARGRDCLVISSEVAVQTRPRTA